MGRKSRKKKLDRWWEECLKNAEAATASQKANALNIFLDISAQIPVRRSEKFSRALNRVFDVYGDIIGSLVMVEFAKSEGFIRTKSPDKCLISKELTN